VPLGDCQRAFGEAARRDGVRLEVVTIEGLTDAGHLGLPASATSAKRALRAVFVALGGDEDDLRAGGHRPLRPDWFHGPSGTAIEVDERQHFTTDRIATLTRYPSNAALGFDLSEYLTLCEAHRSAADRYRAAKEARGFRRDGGRRAQRAYFDAIRDLAIPALGFAPVIRVPALDDDGAGAYRRVRQPLRALLGLA
jgi:hypothetical protein